MLLLNSIAVLSNLSFGEKMAEGLTTTGLGMIVVFSVLILLIFVLTVVGRFMTTSGKGDAENLTVAKSEPVAIAAPPTAGSPTVDTGSPSATAITLLGNEGILVAVISAAIAAYSGGTAANYKISSIKRLAPQSDGWAGEARRDLFASRRG